MNNISSIKSSVSFNGLIVNGVVSGQNVKKLGEFASKVENINFIKDIEKTFGVDAVLDSDIAQMSFSHKIYGSLSGKYRCGSYPLENVFRDVTKVILDIKSAINKASKDWEKKTSEIESSRRGC